jgi:pseudaminic acid cytidylyltransferase
MQSSSYESIFSVVGFSYPIQRGLQFKDDKIKMIWPENLNARSQDLEECYHDAGQFYFFKTDFFTKEKKLWGDNTGGYVLSELEVQDLDTETDWQLAELKYKLVNNLV